MLNLNKLKNLSFVLLSFLPGAVMAQYENPLPVDPNVKVGKLPNGFTYYVRKNVEPKNRAVLYLAIKIGSVLEDDNQQGVAHFVEHMGFDGTTHYPKSELINYLQKTGVRFGADVNAFTSFDETVYQLPIPTDDPSVLSNGIQIIRDWAQEATLDPAEIDRERNVVLEEKRFRSGSGERINRKTYPLVLNNSRYGKRIPIGTEEVLTTVKAETIKQFYHDWYRPDLEAIIAVGDFDVDKMVQTIKSKFSDLKNPENEKERTVYHVSLTDGHQFEAITDQEHPEISAEIVLKRQATVMRTEDDYRNNIILSLFNILIQNRYRELKISGNPEIANTSAGVKLYPGGINVYDARVTTTPQNLEASLKTIWRESVKAAKFGFTHDEFVKAYRMFYGSKTYAYQHRDKITSATYVNQYLNNFLRGNAIPGEWEDMKLTEYLLPKISLLSIDQFCNQYISSPNRDVIIVGPEKDKDKLPDMQTVEKWLSDVLQEDIAVPTDADVKNQQLIVKKPSKSKITSQKVIDGINVTELVLSNGLKIVIKPTPFENSLIRFTSFGIGGTDPYNEGADRLSAVNSAAIIKAGGLGDFTATQLKQFLENHQVIVSPYIDRYFEGVAGTCTTRNMEVALQMINQYFTNPRKDSSAYNAYLDKLKTAAANRRPDNDSVAKGRDLNQITLNRVYDIYKERFGNAADFTFVFVGNLDVKDIIPLLERYLGSLPSVAHPDNYAAVKPAPFIRKSKITYSGVEPKAKVTLRYLGDYNYSYENNTQLQALTEVLKIRLNERLRLQERAIYHTDVSYNITTIPNSRFTLTINFICAPENVEKLTMATLDEIDQIKKNGPDALNVEKYRAARKRLMETQLNNNIFWLNYLSQQYVNNANAAEILNYAAMADTVTPETIKTWTNSYLTTANYERRLILPESAKK